MKFTILTLLLGIMLIGMASAEVNELDSVKQNDCILIPQTCASCTYVNITVTHENSTILENVGMSNNGASWTYLFCNTSDLGRYDIQGKGDLEGTETSFGVYYFFVKNSNLILLYTLIGLAILFFIATLFAEEEFFVYISGVLFIISGVYMMINGIDLVSDWYSRAISYVFIGIGFLFTIGAYLYSSYRKEDDDDDE